MFRTFLLLAVAASLAACAPAGGVASPGSTPADPHASTPTVPAASDRGFIARVTAAAKWYTIAALAYRTGDMAGYSAAMEQASAALAGLDSSP